MSYARLTLLSLLSLCGTVAFADVSCPSIFGDHMVLERERPIAIWGDAAAGEHVTVEFAGQTKTTDASTEGHWRVDLAALPASKDPRTLTVHGTNTLTFSDVLVGEVWLCSGQSNMEKQIGPRKGQKPTDNYEEEIRQANHPLLRLFQMPHFGKPTEKTTSLCWVSCTPETIVATEFSAAGYFFGRELQQKLDVPVGLIHSSYGGTRIEAWLPPAVFERPDFRDLPGGPTDKSFKDVPATKLYQTMIAPLVPYTLRGFLWYQGESNLMAGNTSIYALKMRTLIETWRALWSAPEAPFNYVLIAPFHYAARDQDRAHLTTEGLPAFWQAQIAALDVPHTGLVSTTDIVANLKDIHPTNKREVGLRLARIALADTYGKHELVARSPRYGSMRFVADGKIELSFADTGTGLASRDGKPLDNFIIAGDNHHFVSAEVVVQNDKIIVSNAEVKKPVAVRFAWDEAANPNLVNSAGLPALPFRTDDWPLNLERPVPPPAPATASPAVAPQTPVTK